MSIKIYFAGGLFSYKELLGNAALASALDNNSKFNYECILPQTLEQRDTTPEAIKTQDIKTLMSCDVALFNFDGTELDSGTVVEFIISKMLDIPAIILRSDFRNGGDQKKDPWNLMVSNYPRTKVIIVDPIQDILKKENDKNILTGCRSIATNHVSYITMALSDLADNIIIEFEKLIAMNQILIPATLSTYVDTYQLVAKSCGITMNYSDIFTIVYKKIDKGILEKKSEEGFGR